MMTERLFYIAFAPFEAARQVSILPEGHPSARLHGHSFLAKVRARNADSLVGEGDRLDQLGEMVHKVVEPLNYRLLNEVVDVPTDENLARYVRRGLSLTELDLVGIQSTRGQGVDLDVEDTAHIWKRFRFEAAHRLPNVHEGHPCGRMHGHGFEVVLHVRQNVSSMDMGVQFETLEAAWHPLHQRLNRACLNEVAGLENPTSEMIARWIWRVLIADVPSLSWVSVFETRTAGCHFDGTKYRIWKEQTFESAVARIRNASYDYNSLHGHSYLIRLHLSSELDEVMGWTVDYGDVKTAFRPVFERLDHHALHEISSLKDTDPASILEWARQQASNSIPQLDRIDLFESPYRGASISWGVDRLALPA